MDTIGCMTRVYITWPKPIPANSKFPYVRLLPTVTSHSHILARPLWQPCHLCVLSRRPRESPAVLLKGRHTPLIEGGGGLSNSQHPEHFNCLKILIAPTLLQMDKHAHAPYPFVGPHLAHTSPCKINSGIRYWSYNPINFIATNNGDEPYWLCWVCENAVCRRSSR